MATKRSPNLVGLIVSSAVGVAAPLAGAAISVVLLRRAFQGTAGPAVAPSQKAQLLAQGISEAMNGAAAGLLVSLAALVAAIVFGIRLVRERRTPRG